MQEARRVIEGQLARGCPFETIESYISSRRDLSPEAQSALWLLAWVETDPDERRSAVDELLAMFG
jgi:hypothetical protein